MLIPQINLATNIPSEQSTLAERIKHWSLFGRIALVGVEPDHLESLVETILTVGGLVDLQIELIRPNEQDALTLLNAGASSMICPADGGTLEDRLSRFGSIPEERLTYRIDSDCLDQAIPAGHVVALSEPTAERIAELEMARIHCYVDTNHLDDAPEMIADSLSSVLVSDRADGLWPTLIVDPLGVALGLAYSNNESLVYAIEHRCGAYWSRSREGLWVKGETSGATQKLLEIRLDCDRDCLRFMVTQDAPGFCHLDTYTCFGEQRTLQSVIYRLIDRIRESDEESFTHTLANNAKMLEAKLLEEAQELSDAAQHDCPEKIAWEAADVFYFSLIAMLKNGVQLDQVYHELARRMNRVVRRENKTT